MWFLRAHSVVSVCLSELATHHLCLLRIGILGYGITFGNHEPRAQSGCLGTHVDLPLKFSSYRQLWSQRFGVQAWPHHLSAVGPRAVHASNQGWQLG